MKALLPNKKQGHCDDCGTVKLVVRDDDKENIIKERLEIYKEKTEPILDFYRGQKDTQVISFEAKRGVDDFPEMRDYLQKHINHF
jgi:adenylate kinase